MMMCYCYQPLPTPLSLHLMVGVMNLEALQELAPPKVLVQVAGWRGKASPLQQRHRGVRLLPSAIRLRVGLLP